MGPKQKKKDISITELKSTAVELDALHTQPPPPPDPYSELRFTPLPVDAQPLRPAPKHARALVLKKKRLPQQPPAPVQIQITNQESIETTKSTESKWTEFASPAEMFSKNSLKGRDDMNLGILNAGASNPRGLVKWFGPGELPLEPPPLAVLRRATEPNSAYQHSLHDSLRKESALLSTFNERKRQELAMEDLLIQKTGKARPNLLLRKQQHLPHVDGEGQEISRLRLERTETPEIVYDNVILCEAAHKVREINGLRRTLTRRERGYPVIQDWLGYPEVTDHILKELNHRGEAHLKTKSDEREAGVSYQDGEFVPMLEELGVVGLKYERAQLLLKELQRFEQNKCGQKQKFFGENLTSSQPWSTGVSAQVLQDNANPNQQQSLPAISFGQVKLSWSLDPDRAKKTWVVELGCTAEMGHNAVASITMSNIGTTAVHFSWKKLEPANAFQLKRRSLRRFVFDCWGGTFLPGETFRVPVLYKGLEPGFFSEDWLLQTQPVLENGAPIVTRLWGVTRLYDPFRLARLDLDDGLASRCTRTIAEHQVKKWVDHLTLNEVPLKDTRFPLVLLGPDLFHLNNPWLKYHCASVYRLGKLFAMTENKRVRTLTMDTMADKASLYIFTDSNSIAEELPSASKLTVNSVLLPTNDQLMASNQSVDYEQSTLLKSGWVSDEGSVFSDEEVGGSSIRHIKKLIEEQINPDTPILGPVETEPIEDDIFDDDDGGGGAIAGKRKRPLAINLTNVDFSVDQMRENILGNVVDSQEHREAQFQIMSEQVARLLFRTDMPLDIWKTVVARGLLCIALDSFADFAQSLKKCCEGQILFNDADDEKMRPGPLNPITEDEEAEAGGDVEDEEEMLEVAMEEDVVDNEKSASESNESSETSSESVTPIPCSKTAPKQALLNLRYTDQYMSRLYCRMYHLLTDYFDNLDVLLSEVRKLKISQDEVGFTRIRQIPMNLSIEDMLNAPLPPSWVLMAQRMDDTVQRVQARKEQLLKENNTLAT